MNSLLLCIFLTFLMTYLAKIPVIVAMSREKNGYNNQHPRDQQAKLVGWARRAAAAQQNFFEISPFFIAAALIALMQQANPFWAATLAWIFVAARALYPIFYIANLDSLRSTFWFVGFLSTGGLFWISIFK